MSASTVELVRIYRESVLRKGEDGSYDISESKWRIELYLFVDGGGEVYVDLEGKAGGERRGSVDKKTRKPWRVVSNGIIRSQNYRTRKPRTMTKTMS